MKKLYVFIIALCIFLTSNVYGQSVTKTIGENEVTFNIPSDYDTLLRYYKTLIDTYVNAENEIISIKKQSADYIQSTNNTFDKYDKIISSKDEIIKNDETQIANLKNAKLGYKWYFGGIFGVSSSFFGSSNFKVFSLSPVFSYVNGDKGYIINVELPTINFQTTSINDINIGLSAGFSYHF